MFVLKDIFYTLTNYEDNLPFPLIISLREFFSNIEKTNIGILFSLAKDIEAVSIIFDL